MATNGDSSRMSHKTIWFSERGSLTFAGHSQMRRSDARGGLSWINRGSQTVARVVVVATCLLFLFAPVPDAAWVACIVYR